MASSTYISALVRCLRSGDNRAAIVAAGGIPALVQRISSSDAGDDLLEAAARLLNNLSVGSPANAAAIAAAGGIPAVVQCLCSSRSERHLRSSSCSEHVQLQAARVLVILVRDPEIREAVAAAGGIPLLVQCLSSSTSEAILRTTASEQVQAAAAGALALLSRDSPDNSAAIAASGGIVALQQLLYSPPSEAVRRATAASLVSLSNSAGV
ncbi:hypothetical protein CHLNCDRAFT_141142 [Chlorella variabilis]|uniref:Armadillo repeat-containing domain-containing protein n=1 Tax=Chlorella variabilis TaxID=554065 RepID=E1ZS19_CHLVA|nr:hypothetical protein CHLNCDRAFT_141142 [Chlorella variabilis]EFN51368.1 hypothetical protein CHLNCDRAFT_141142 [Chlorella variabilis]|eukprot:XP_005843470.1 hypothetical protein CHLNCDRAFT_141142 [Chlorella variabilis]